MKYMCIIVLLGLMGCQSYPVSSGYTGMDGIETCTFENEVQVTCEPTNEG